MTSQPQHPHAASASIGAGRFAGDWVIDLANVEKVYSGRFGRGRVHALRGIDMKVHRGSVFGLLGPNGAGKSTLVKILMTVIRPTRCEGTFLGSRVGDKAMLRRVGYLPEHHKFPDYLTAWQVLDYFGALSRVRRADRRRRGDALLELVGLKQWRDRKVRGFSKGMRQRLGIANALTGDPDLVVLDEPTDGVDPVGRRDIRNILTRLRDEGRTVFLNSHLLSELEMICDRVAILVQGVVAAQGTIHELTTASRRYEIEVAASDPARVAAALAGVVAAGPPGSVGTGKAGGGAGGALWSGATGEGVAVHIEHASAGSSTGGTLVVRIASDEARAAQPFIDALRGAGLTIRAVRPLRASLEDLFMQAVTDPSTGAVFEPGAQLAEVSR